MNQFLVHLPHNCSGEKLDERARACADMVSAKIVVLKIGAQESAGELEMLGNCGTSVLKRARRP